MLNSTPPRLAAFAAALALLGGGAAAVGAATDAAPPFQDCLKTAAAHASQSTGAMPASGESHGGEPMIEPIPGSDGRRASLAGLELTPSPRSFEAGGSTTWRFRIIDCDGKAVREFDPELGKLLHLIVVRTDFTGYQHLHPTLSRDGTFSVALATPRAGRYRAIADFVVGGRKYVLGTTLTAGGRAKDEPVPAPALAASTDGYNVELRRPAVLEAGKAAQLTFRVTRDGRPVRDLQPYLGAYGHLVALHAPDLAYSHVHPNGEALAEGAITFDTALHRAGTYRLFMQFQTDGRVHTVAFTQTVS